MAEFENKKLEKTNVNQGQEFKNGDGVGATDINALVSGVLYNTEKLQTMGSITIISEVDYPNQDGSATPFPNMSMSVFQAIYQELGKGNAVFYKPFSSEITPVLANNDNIQLLVNNVLYTYSIIGSEVTYTTKDLSKCYEKKEKVNILDGVVAATNFIAETATSNEGGPITAYAAGKIYDNTNGTEINIPQNRNGTFALTEDVENKLDKITINDNVPAVYAINTDNTQTTARLDFLDTGTYNAIPRRNGSLNIFLPNLPENSTDSANKKYVDDLGATKTDKDYVFVNEIVLEEDSKNFVLNTDSVGNDLSGYSEFLIIFVGKFTNTFSNRPFELFFANGSIYQMWNTATASSADTTYVKVMKTTRQYITHIDKYFYQCSFTDALQSLSSTDSADYLWQGLLGLNANMRFDSSMTIFNWSSMNFGMRDEEVLFKTGSKLLVLGKK